MNDLYCHPVIQMIVVRLDQCDNAFKITSRPVTLLTMPIGHLFLLAIRNKRPLLSRRLPLPIDAHWFSWFFIPTWIFVISLFCFSPSVLARSIAIENIVNGSISVQEPASGRWIVVGRVVKPINNAIHSITESEFTASTWAPTGSIAAVAVNALHIKSGQAGTYATLFSILPSESMTDKPSSYRDAETSIVTNINAGTSIFSAPLAPAVGDPLFIQQPNGTLTPWTPNSAPLLGQTLVIQPLPAPSIDWIEFDNRWGGQVTQMVDGIPTVIAVVYRPFRASGRFGGSSYQSPGRVRANHPGVICISTSRQGQTGGFQIIPAIHANSPNLNYVSSVLAYMVIGPVDQAHSLEGSSPLFRHTIKPGSLVTARINGTWQPLPQSEGFTDKYLNGIEAIRIYPYRNN